jgi:5'-deoxynucleotidase YfbR-like HD superfamily hydrolase
MDRNRDSINRGFHLQYYGDVPAEDSGISPVLCDDVNNPAASTIKNLVANLSSDIERAQFRPMTMIEAQTLASLAASRHIAGILPDTVRPAISSLLNDLLLAHQSNYFDPIRGLLETSKEVLSKASVSLAAMIKDFWRLKDTPRGGWNSQCHLNGRNELRHCSASESVADHTFGTALLGILMLPETIEGMPEYSKNSVLRMILIHDLAESIQGDIPSFEKSEAMLEVGETLIRSRMTLCHIAGVPGASDLVEHWSELQRGESINALLARDLDAIEGLVQMQLYADRPECRIPDRELWERHIYEAVRTEQGRKILDTFLNNHVCNLK